MQKLNLLEEPVPKLFIKYLMPSISATLVTSIYILADTLMIGRGVGAVGIAALNLLAASLIQPVFWNRDALRRRRRRSALHLEGTAG